MAIEDGNALLLGIKYEAARLGGVKEAALRVIEEQLEEEIGGDWRLDGAFVRGRNAVRGEHGLPPLGGGEGPADGAPKRRPLWRRMTGR